MRILFLSSRFPYPLTQGDRVRAYHFLRLLAEDHQITLITPIQTPQEYEGLASIEAFCERVEVVPISAASRWLNLIQAPFRALPLQVTYYRNRRFQQRVDQILAQAEFDVIHVQLARMATFLQGSDQTPRLLDFIDALSLNMARRAKQEKGIKAWLFATEARRMLRYERQLVNQFHQLTISSPIDKEAIGDYSNLEVIPNGVDLQKFPFVMEERQPKTLLFAGNMRYFPNINAVQYFIDEVLPLIRVAIPEVKLTVVGPSLPESWQKKFLQPDVTLAGFVPNVHDYLKRASVAIAPMQSGSGIQNKVLEAMATGTPVVSTTYGIGSLPVESGKHLMIATDAHEFAQAVIQLLNDRALHQHIAVHARQLVEQHFTWEQAVKKLRKRYEQAVMNPQSLATMQQP
jgi:polysaccharide biosynthesis protein PslH